MSTSRAEIVRRLMAESADETTDFESLRRRNWTDLNLFVKDNLKEVHSKLSKIESEVWGKLIVMEKGFRTAKAYLRAPIITIDDSPTMFDGNRIGLSNFVNENRDSKDNAELKTVGKGIRIQIDSLGNIWMKRNSDSAFCVQCTQYPEPLFLDREYQKILDVRAFRNSILHELDISAAVDKEKLFKKAVIFIKLSDPSPQSNPLKCSFWCLLIHLISVEIINALVEQRHSASPSPSSHKSFELPLNSPKRPNDDIGVDSAADDSSASTSSYVPSFSSFITKPNSSKSSGGVARRIFGSNNPSRRSISMTRDSCPSPAPRPNQHYYSVPKEIDNLQQQQPKNRNSPSTGWSLLNLTDIDKMQKPLFFASAEEAGRSRKTKRGGSGHHFSTKNENRLRLRWQSEGSLRNAA